MSSRYYLKRVWRVPKDRGATEYFAALLAKALIKHGWPAVCRVDSGHIWVSHKSYQSESNDFDDGLGQAPADFYEAVSIACRILSRTYRVEVVQNYELVYLQGVYDVMPGGFFREVKPNEQN